MNIGPQVVVPPAVEPVPVVEPKPVVVVEEDVDGDGDGVIDSLDQCPNTPTNLVVDERGCPIQGEEIEELQMELRVFFDNDKTNIKDQYKPEIAKVAERCVSILTQLQASKITLRKLVHLPYNQRLSEASTLTVKNMLTNEFGVAPNRLSTVGYGYSRPIADNDTEEGRAMNRVYAVITGNKTTTVDITKDMNVQ